MLCPKNYPHEIQSLSLRYIDPPQVPINGGIITATLPRGEAVIAKLRASAAQSRHQGMHISRRVVFAKTYANRIAGEIRRNTHSQQYVAGLCAARRAGGTGGNRDAGIVQINQKQK